MEKTNYCGRAPPVQEFPNEILEYTEEKVMWQKNNGHSEAERLQNQFTAYLSMAVQRRRKEYIMQAIRQKERESLTENPISDPDYDILQDVLDELPLLMRLENDSLLYALKELNERERNIFLARVLDEKSFAELAGITGLSYEGVAAVYYRALRRIRKRMKEVDNEF